LNPALQAAFFGILKLIAAVGHLVSGYRIAFKSYIEVNPPSSVIIIYCTSKYHVGKQLRYLKDKLNRLGLFNTVAVNKTVLQEHGIKTLNTHR
jgi:hypothetical protein